MTDVEFDSMKSETYWPFDNESQWLLAERTLFPTPLADSVIKRLAIESNCPWITSGLGFKSLADLKRRLDKIPSKGGEWMESHVIPMKEAPSWAPHNIPFWKRDSLEVMKSMIGDVRLAKDMKWAPEKIFNANDERIYSELWTADWWWKMQVRNFGNHR